MSNQIIVIEDDQNLRETLVDILEIEGYTVFAAANLASAKEAMSSASYDLCILDIMLPDGDGYDFAQYLRESYPNTMILMLTARNLARDIETGFESGADDYVSKPYQLNELLLRIKALLRRRSSGSHFDAEHKDKRSFNVNGYLVNKDSYEVRSEAGEIVHLTKTEFDLLCYFVENLNKALSREQILNAVWGREKYIDNRTVDNFVSKLKKTFQMADDAEYAIKSVRGVGYILSLNN